MRIGLKIIFLVCFSGKVFAQDSTSFFSPSAEFSKKRCYGVAGLQAVGYGGSLALLSTAWYQEYDQTSFHSFDDSREWLQMDKAGHALTSWYLGGIGIDMMEWTGMNKKKSILYGAAGSFLYLTGIEVLDGFSQGWGFSWSDFAANSLGTGFIIGQKFLESNNSLFAKGIRGMSLKFSFHQTNFPTVRPNLLGNNFGEQILKDYNGQSYWLSINLSSFMSRIDPTFGVRTSTKFPKWLNIAFGYGGEGMITGDPDDYYVDENNNSIWMERYRQYYISLDIDLTRIKTKSHFLKTVFKTISFIKIPAPALEFSKRGMKAHAFYY